MAQQRYQERGLTDLHVKVKHVRDIEVCVPVVVEWQVARTEFQNSCQAHRRGKLSPVIRPELLKHGVSGSYVTGAVCHQLLSVPKEPWHFKTRKGNLSSEQTIAILFKLTSSFSDFFTVFIHCNSRNYNEVLFIAFILAIWSLVSVYFIYPYLSVISTIGVFALT